MTADHPLGFFFNHGLSWSGRDVRHGLLVSSITDLSSMFQLLLVMTIYDLDSCMGIWNVGQRKVRMVAGRVHKQVIIVGS
jgi:hypothetical protein